MNTTTVNGNPYQQFVGLIYVDFVDTISNSDIINSRYGRHSSLSAAVFHSSTAVYSAQRKL